MLMCAITDRRRVGETPATQCAGLIAQARLWAENGVALVQLREKDLPAPELIVLAKAMQQAIRDVGAATKIILNASLAVVLAAGADGIHLSSDRLPSEKLAQRLDEIRSHFVTGADTAARRPLWVSVACHTLEEVEQAREQKADCILFAPVFEKQIAEKEISDQQGTAPMHNAGTLVGVGLEALAAACRAAHPVPVLALGGVTASNAAACIAAGASGIAAIRLFQGQPCGWSALR